MSGWSSTTSTVVRSDRGILDSEFWIVDSGGRAAGIAGPSPGASVSGWAEAAPVVSASPQSKIQNRQRHLEGAALARRARHRDLAAVEGHQLVAQRQADARARRGRALPPPALVEPLEDTRQVLRRDAHPGVGHDDAAGVGAG